MNLLAIDTSTDVASVAISLGTSLYSLEQRGVRQHAQHLLPMIQTLLQEHGLEWSALQGIVFDAGPGSFTGLRIACSIAKALAYAHHLPVFGISSIQAIAFQARAHVSQPDVGILACGDARMQELYWAYYPPEAPLTEIAIRVDPVAVIKILDTHPIVLAGWGLETYQAQWCADLQRRFIANYAMHPKADTLIRMVQSGKYSAASAADAQPLYVRNQVTHTGETHG